MTSPTLGGVTQFAGGPGGAGDGAGDAGVGGCGVLAIAT